ncbi:unnamed protein product [Lepidochelys olivacea]
MLGFLRCQWLVFTVAGWAPGAIPPSNSQNLPQGCCCCEAGPSTWYYGKGKSPPVSLAPTNTPACSRASMAQPPGLWLSWGQGQEGAVLRQGLGAEIEGLFLAGWVC